MKYNNTRKNYMRELIYPDWYITIDKEKELFKKYFPFKGTPTFEEALKNAGKKKKSQDEKLQQAKNIIDAFRAGRHVDRYIIAVKPDSKGEKFKILNKDEIGLIKSLQEKGAPTRQILKEMEQIPTERNLKDFLTKLKDEKEGIYQSEKSLVVDLKKKKGKEAFLKYILPDIEDVKNIDELFITSDSSISDYFKPKKKVDKSRDILDIVFKADKDPLLFKSADDFSFSDISEDEEEEKSDFFATPSISPLASPFISKKPPPVPKRSESLLESQIDISKSKKPPPVPKRSESLPKSQSKKEEKKNKEKVVDIPKETIYMKIKPDKDYFTIGAGKDLTDDEKSLVNRFFYGNKDDIEYQDELKLRQIAENNKLKNRNLKNAILTYYINRKLFYGDSSKKQWEPRLTLSQVKKLYDILHTKRHKEQAAKINEKEWLDIVEKVKKSPDSLKKYQIYYLLEKHRNHDNDVPIEFVDNYKILYKLASSKKQRTQSQSKTQPPKTKTSGRSKTSPKTQSQSKTQTTTKGGSKTKSRSKTPPKPTTSGGSKTKIKTPPKPTTSGGSKTEIKTPPKSQSSFSRQSSLTHRRKSGNQ